MKKQIISALLVGAMAVSLAACGSSGEAGKTAESGAAQPANVEKEDDHTLSVYAWDKNFNIPALEAA